LYYFLHNLNGFKKILADDSIYILNKQHIINNKLINFGNIPVEIINIIENEFINMYKKYNINDSYILKSNNNNNKNTYIFL